MAAGNFFLPYNPVFSANGLPVAKASVTFYTAGTTTKTPIYADEALTTELPNPVPSNGAGRLPAIYLADGAYHVVITSDDGEVLQDIDPYLPGDYPAGPTGPANSTYATVALLRAAQITNDSAILTAKGLAGVFRWDANETRADNGRTIIKSNGSTTGAWVKIADANIIPIAQFGLLSDGSDETAKITAWMQAIAASAATGIKTIGKTGSAALYFNVVTAGFPAGDVMLDFEQSVFHPLSQTGGRFEITGVDLLTIANVGKGAYTQRFHIDPVFKIVGTGILTTTNCNFEDCGAGISAFGLKAWNGDVRGANVGVMPRPAPLDPTGAGFAAGFERYGFIVRPVQCDGGTLTVNGEHLLPAGGASSDVTGGAGHASGFLCNNMTLRGRSVNSPGQGFIFAGGWQGDDILAQFDAGTFDSTKRGQNCSIENVSGYGANQELSTLFGMGNSKIDGVSGADNRACVAESWNSWSCTVRVTSARESAAADHPISKAGLGALGGRGAVHVIGCFDTTAQVDVSVARHAGVSMAGSRRCSLTGPIRNYGAANDSSPSLRAAVDLGVGVYGKVATPIYINNLECLRHPANTTGGTFFIQNNAQDIRYYGVTQLDGAVTIVGGDQSAKGAPPEYFKAGFSGGGVSPLTPGWRELVGQMTTAITTAKTILTLTPITNPYDAAELVVSGYQEANGAQRFRDLISASPGVADVQVVSTRNMGTPPARTYSVDIVTGQLRLASGGDAIRVNVEGRQYAQPLNS